MFNLQAKTTLILFALQQANQLYHAVKKHLVSPLVAVVVASQRAASVKRV